ncbi:putative carboxylesterase [Helianthus annuus]|uniref:Carboxylesterase n=1 Tax=Helianthus annuus TaxID=4232 RepID=A0A9K3JHZ2_HELAN|nr:putative carboxylesterase [Helianthus annuus]
MVHWLADKGKLKLDENVANIWPEFGVNGKDQIKVNHILNHTSGLHNALAGVTEDPKLFCDWDECLKRIAMAAPETEPGRQLIYHYLSYGWLCGGIIEHVSGKKFQDILEESIVRPLNVEGELYIGIPPGVESRLATLAIDADDPSRLAPKAHPGIPSSLTLTSISNLIALLNILDGRRAIVPGGNGHFSARALARYYATLVDGGVIPPRHPSSSLPSLGSHPHHPMNKKDENQNQNQNKEDTTDEVETTIFVNPKAKIHDAFLGTGDYKNLTLPNGVFGLGFSRCRTAGGSLFGFGHAGLGGSTAYCDINNRFAIAVTLNKLCEGALTGEIIRFICSQLDLPVPLKYVGST